MSVSNTFARSGAKGGRDKSRGSGATLYSGIGGQLIRAFTRQLGGTREVSEGDGLHHVTLTFAPRDGGGTSDGNAQLTDEPTGDGN